MSLIWRSFHIASRQVFYILVFIAVMAMLVIGAAVWLSESIESRKDEIASWVSEKTGYPIEIGHAGLSWRGLSPKLQVNNIKVFHQNNSKELLTLDHIYFGIDVISSARLQEPVLKDVSLSGLTVNLLRTEQGDFQLEGLSDHSGGELNAFQWLKLLKKINLQQMSVSYTDRVNNEISGVYQLENAVVSHQDDRWSINASIALPESLGDLVIVTGDITLAQQGWESSSWQGQFKTNKLVLTPITNQFDLGGIVVEQGNATMRVTAEGMGSNFDKASIELDMSGGKLISNSEATVDAPVLIQQLVGKFEWRHQNDYWQLSAQDVALNINGGQWPKTYFTMSKNKDGLFSAESDYLRLSDLTSIALLTTYLPDFLRQQKPAGDIEDIHIKYDMEQGVQDVALTLKELIILPWKDMPGITGLSAIVDWRNGSGSLNIDSQDVSFYPETWLDDAIFFDAISGLFYWQQDETGWSWKSDALRVWNDDLDLQLEGNVEQRNGKDYADLKLILEQVVANRWQSYVPQRLLSQDFSSWAKDAFVAGKIIDGHIRLKGDPSKFPFEQAPDEGEFDLLLNVEDVQLHYATGWPDLFDVTGSITGKGNDLIIKSSQGLIADFKFADVTTTITKLVEDEPMLVVNGLLNGTTQQALNFLKNSPLNPRFGSITDLITATGNSNIQLDLIVPLADPDAAEAKGYVSFIDSLMTLNEMPEVPFSMVKGNLQFSNNGVQAQNIKAVFLEQPIAIGVIPQDETTVVNVQGKISTQNINHIWPELVPDYVLGQAIYQAEVTIAEKELGEFTVDVNVNSDLGGIAIDMPTPIGKTGEKLSSFAMSIQHIDEENLLYSASYAGLVNAAVSPTDKAWRGELRFGTGQAVLPEAGFIVTGQLSELSIDDWTLWQDRLIETENSSVLESIDRISMNIDSLSGFQQQLTNVAFSAERAAQDWRISLFSEQAKGNIKWPHDIDGVVPITLDFDYIKLQLPEDDVELDQLENVRKLDDKISLWPSITLDSKNLYVNDLSFGEIHVRAIRQGSNWLLNSASLVSEVINASAKGSWRQTENGMQSQFEMNAYSSDLKGLLGSFNYQQAIEAKSFETKINLNWPGSPIEYSHEKSVGQLTIDVGKGTLIDVKPGAAGRIFGLLSVAAIPRRLSLDFSDLFGKGFGFSSITGSFGIHNGLAQTDDLIMKGDSAKIEVTGPVDLVEQSYNQVVKVTPDVSSTLPIAGAAAGPVGIGVGAAILVVDKIVNKLFDKNIVNLISYSYDLTGPWDDPQMSIVKPPKH